MNDNLNVPKQQDVLLVAEKEDKQLKAVTGINEDGTPKTIDPSQKNEPEFLKIDKHSNALENFMSNFLRQCKEPTHFQFFKVPLELIEKVLPVLQEMLKNPETPSNKEALDTHRVLPEEFSKKEYQPIDESRIDWSQLEQLGVDKKMLEQTKSLDKMLNWQKSPVLLPIKAQIGEMTIRTDARLSFREAADGKLNLFVHGLRKEPELEGFVYGIRLNEDDKQALRQTGNLGRIIEVEPIKDQKMMAFLSIDKLTNEVIALRADKIKIPNQVKGVDLSEAQQKDLSQGKAVHIEGMTAKSGKVFDASIQINADKRGFDFKFDNTPKLEQASAQEFRIPTRLLGAELSPDQQTKLKADQTIYVKGMTNDKGEVFDSYVKVNHEKAKFDFLKWNPDKKKEIADDTTQKTQAPTNAEDKTNKEPNKKEEQQAEQKQTQKPRGRRM